MVDNNIFNNDYFEIYKMDHNEIIVQSKNTGHFWYIRKCMGKIEVSHKHYINQVYHREKWKIKTLVEARERIIKHDIYQMNGRRPVDNQFMDYLVTLYK